MRKYEGVLVFKPDLEDEARNQAFDRIKETIESNGKISEISDWGKRKLAYEINYIKEGYYYIVEFEANPELITEIERRSRISDAIIRYMFVRKDA
ncbi:MAG: 30S ribosomal protein S6 [Miniphocaeibacter sp.]|uniref:30S ribosomal protein S6 n=1 Tax=Miniphocaeibacter sp. TaxID=3100973 RepID=UPI001826CD9B|nr:30S ribosomal protein S6 [Gallicola sp.]